MKRFLLLISLFGFSVGFAWLVFLRHQPIVTKPQNTVQATTDNAPPVTTTNVQPTIVTKSVAPALVVPIDNFFTRVTTKPFGILINPKTSPVQPERFAGYHTGADAETTPEEQTALIPIRSIAVGTVVFAGYVTGYGGIIMIEHTVDGETITALYGHLRHTSFAVKVNDIVAVGQHIADLGTGYSTETDGERRHLHLGIIKGQHQNTTGYVNSASRLNPWEDPVTWLKAHGAQ